MTMNVTEEVYKHVQVTVTDHNEQNNAETYLREQYNIDDEESIQWIHSASFAPWTGEQLSSEFSTSVRIKVQA